MSCILPYYLRYCRRASHPPRDAMVLLYPTHFTVLNKIDENIFAFTWTRLTKIIYSHLLEQDWRNKYIFKPFKENYIYTYLKIIRYFFYDSCSVIKKRMGLLLFFARGGVRTHASLITGLKSVALNHSATRAILLVSFYLFFFCCEKPLYPIRDLNPQPQD